MRNTRKLLNSRTACLALVIVGTAGIVQIRATGQSVNVQRDVLVDPRVEESMAAGGTARIIVGLDVDVVAEERLTPAAAAGQRAKIGRSQDAVQASLARTSHRVGRRFGFIPAMAMEADTAAIKQLRASPHVRTIELDEELVPSLTQTRSIAHFEETFASGLKGAGSTVAIIDTGVDRYHRFLTGAVVYEACFTSRSTCPDGQTVQIGHGSAVPCDQAGCDHGTHVAGIVAGRGAINAHGVAPAASLYPIQVFSKTTCTAGPAWFDLEVACIKSQTSDSIAALEHVYDRRSAYRFAAVNMSLGSSTTWSDRESCSTSNWSLNDAIRRLEGAGIATVASAGNDGQKNGTSRPACSMEAISVGATTKNDAVTGYSNSAPWLDLLAPGDEITSSVPGGGFETYSGTSMAAPHVAGAWAVLKSVAPEATVDDVLAALRATGRMITDPGNDVATPRVNVSSAVDRLGTIRIEDAVAANEGSTASFRVALAKTYAYPVSVQYRTVAGSAVAPGDYTSAYGQLVFQPGQTSRTVNVQIVDDPYREGAETFSVELTSASGARRNRSLAAGTIRASDSITPTPPPYEGPGPVQSS